MLFSFLPPGLLDAAKSLPIRRRMALSIVLHTLLDELDEDIQDELTPGDFFDSGPCPGCDESCPFYNAGSPGPFDGQGDGGEPPFDPFKERRRWN